MRAVSGVFDDLELSKAKNRLALINWSLRLTYTRRNDHTSRPLHSINRPANLHTLTSATTFTASPATLTATYNYSFSRHSLAFRLFRSAHTLFSCLFFFFPLLVSIFARPSYPSVLMPHPVPVRTRSSRTTSHPVPWFLFRHFFPIHPNSR
jgi:hypothetical protein